MQGIIDWAVGAELTVVEFLSTQLHIPMYLIKLIAVFAVVLWICILIWRFSRHLAHKELFSLNLPTHSGTSLPPLQKGWNILLYILKFLILFPIYTVLWGAVFVFFLTLLVSESNYANVVFFSTIVIAIIRVIAYFNESYALDLAKPLPLWLLVTVMLDPQVLSKAVLTINLAQLLYDDTTYLSIGFIVVVEWTLRAVNGIRNRLKARQKIKQDVS